MCKKVLLVLLVAMSLVIAPINGFAAAAVPTEAVQLLVDDSLDILATYKIGFNHRVWKDLYGKLVRDEARFSVKYPDSEYKRALSLLMVYYGLFDIGWDFYIKGTDDKTSKSLMTSSMENAKESHEKLAKMIK